MSDIENTNGQQEQRQLPPICPHCLDDPFKPQAIPFNTDNGVTLLIFFCETCRKTISAVVLAIPQRRVQPAPRILRPQ